MAVRYHSAGYESAGADVYKRQEFNPNMPTEEIFTMPKKTGVNGKVFATKPLDYNGTLIENFWFLFQDGKVVDFGAEQGLSLIHI